MKVLPQHMRSKSVQKIQMFDNVNVAHSFTPYKCFINPSFTFPCIHNAMVPVLVATSKHCIVVGGDATFIKNANGRYITWTIASLGGCYYMFSNATFSRDTYVCVCLTHINCAFHY